MKRFFYLLIFAMYLGFMVPACNSATQNEEEHDHEHVEGEHDHDHDHDHEEVDQEEFVLKIPQILKRLKKNMIMTTKITIIR